jgi:hypothetical protein
VSDRPHSEHVGRSRSDCADIGEPSAGQNQCPPQRILPGPVGSAAGFRTRASRSPCSATERIMFPRTHLRPPLSATIHDPHLGQNTGDEPIGAFRYLRASSRSSSSSALQERYGAQRIPSMRCVLRTSAGGQAPQCGTEWAVTATAIAIPRSATTPAAPPEATSRRFGPLIPRC